MRPWEIDAEAVERIRAENAAAFADAYVRFLASADTSALSDDDRNVALRLGLLLCHEGPAIADADHLACPWFAPSSLSQPEPGPRASWTAIAQRSTRDRILHEHGWYFDPLPTFVALNDDGWHARDMSAWFASTDEDPEATRAFQRTFVDRFIRPARGEGWLVLVDCHL